MASALFGSTAIGYGDLFDRKVDDNNLLSNEAELYIANYSTKYYDI